MLKFWVRLVSEVGILIVMMVLRVGCEIWVNFGVKESVLVWCIKKINRLVLIVYFKMLVKVMFEVF